MTTRRKLLNILLGLCSACVALPASASPDPTGPIRLIYPFPAGSVGDLLARAIAQSMQDTLKQPVFVENRTGGGGTVGVVAVKNSKPDGTVLLLAPFASFTIVPHASSSLGYDPVKDFEPVSRVATYDGAIAVGPALPVKTVKELTAALKENPKKALYGTAGTGGLGDLLGFKYGKEIGVDMQAVPYKGSAPAVIDLVGGQVPMIAVVLSDMLEQHKAGKIRVIATSGTQRSIDLPDVPTFKESGFDVVGSGWYGLFAPAKTPQARIERINKAVQIALQTPEIKTRIANAGLLASGSTPAELGALIAADSNKWKPIVKESGYKID